MDESGIRLRVVEDGIRWALAQMKNVAVLRAQVGSCDCYIAFRHVRWKCYPISYTPSKSIVTLILNSAYAICLCNLPKGTNPELLTSTVSLESAWFAVFKKIGHAPLTKLS